jgi:hypothetical protein
MRSTLKVNESAFGNFYPPSLRLQRELSSLAHISLTQRRKDAKKEKASLKNPYDQ